METPLPPADGNPRFSASLKIGFLKRIILMTAYWTACVLALYFFYPGEAPFPVFNILASWGVVLGYGLEMGGFIIALLVFFLYLVGLFVINTVLAHYSRRVKWFNPASMKFRLPILPVIIHWTGVYLAFNLHGEFPLPPAKEFISFLGLVFVLTIIVLPSMMSTLYIALDWKFATKRRS